MGSIRIQPEPGDAPEFVSHVEAVVNGILRRHAPRELILIKINNWFGVKWLHFSGKALGALGVWKSDLTIPPFVPNRVISQRRFAAPDYTESERGDLIHIAIESDEARKRRVNDVAHGAALVWYGAGSDQARRGAIMAYVPVGDSYSPWY